MIICWSIIYRRYDLFIHLWLLIEKIFDTPVVAYDKYNVALHRHGEGNHFKDARGIKNRNPMERGVTKCEQQLFKFSWGLLRNNAHHGRQRRPTALWIAGTNEQFALVSRTFVRRAMLRQSDPFSAFGFVHDV